MTSDGGSCVKFAWKKTGGDAVPPAIPKCSLIIIIDQLKWRIYRKGREKRRRYRMYEAWTFKRDSHGSFIF